MRILKIVGCILTIISLTNLMGLAKKKKASSQNSSKNKKNRKYVAYVINLDKRFERWNRMKENWGHALKLKRISAINNIANPVCGLSMSYLKAMEILNNSRSDYMLIFEDDAIPTPDFNITSLKKTITEALTIPSWHILHLGPWFTKQPEVKKMGEFVVSIDYFHTTHFLAIHRRLVETFYDAYKTSLIYSAPTSGCKAVDDYFGNYNAGKDRPSNTIILSSSRSFAIQNTKQLGSDIGGGPVMNPCAINAALAGRKVYIEVNPVKEIIENGKMAYNPVSFKPPLYGYFSSDKTKIYWTHDRCNLDTDDAAVLGIHTRELLEE